MMPSDELNPTTRYIDVTDVEDMENKTLYQIENEATALANKDDWSYNVTQPRVNATCCEDCVWALQDSYQTSDRTTNFKPSNWGKFGGLIKKHCIEQLTVPGPKGKTYSRADGYLLNKVKENQI